MEKLKEYLFANPKTTLIGSAQLINNIVAAIEVYNQTSGGMVPAGVMVQFLSINAALQFLKGAVTQDVAKSNPPVAVVGSKS